MITFVRLWATKTCSVLKSLLWNSNGECRGTTWLNDVCYAVKCARVSLPPWELGIGVLSPTEWKTDASPQCPIPKDKYKNMGVSPVSKIIFHWTQWFRSAFATEPKRVGAFLSRFLSHFCWKHTFITVLTIISHLSRSWATWIHSTLSLSFLMMHFNIIFLSWDLQWLRRLVAGFPPRRYGFYSR